MRRQRSWIGGIEVELNSDERGDDEMEGIDPRNDLDLRV